MEKHSEARFAISSSNLTFIGIVIVTALISVVTVVTENILILVVLLSGTLILLLAGYLLLRVLSLPFIGMVLLVLLLPFHSLILLVLIGFLQLPFTIGQVFQVWKELLLILLVILAFVKARGRIRVRVRVLDYLMIMFLVLQSLYLFIPSEHTTVTSVLYGLRNNNIFIVAYFVGRLIKISEVQATKLVDILLGVTVVVSIFAIIEIFVLPSDILGRLGYATYHQNFLGLALPTEARFRNLPVQLYSEFSVAGQHVMLRRAGSTYVNSVIFSFTQLIAIPIMFSLLLSRQWPRSRFMLIAVVLIGILLGITRSALLGLSFAACALLIPSLAKGRLPKLVFWLSLIAFPVVLIISYQLNLHHLVLNTIRLQDSSSQVHYNAIIENIHLTIENPWGYGLGVVGTAAHRSSAGIGGGGESWYFQMVLQLGVVGGILAVLIILFSLVSLWHTHQRLTKGKLKAVALGLFASGVGFAVASNFLHTWDYLQVAIPYWLLAGVAIQQHDHILYGTPNVSQQLID